jgi:hypothetical protein
MWPDALHELRDIEFVFPAIDPRRTTRPRPYFDDPSYLDLRFAIIRRLVQYSGVTMKAFNVNLSNGTETSSQRFVLRLNC